MGSACDGMEDAVRFRIDGKLSGQEVDGRSKVRARRIVRGL